MSRLLPCLVALCLAPVSTFSQDIGVSIGGGVVQANGQPPRDARLATGHAAIRGRVLASDGGQPLRRATVRINAPELRVARTALTDPDGRYDFRDFPAGRYSINASKPTFVNWSYGQTLPNGPGKPSRFRTTRRPTMSTYACFAAPSSRAASSTSLASRCRTPQSRR